MDIIPVEISKVPYTFEIDLSKVVYTIGIEYNILFDFFTATLYLNGSLLATEKIVFHEFLFREFFEDKNHNINPNFPSGLIYVGSEDNTIDRVSITNLGTKVFLYYIERSEILAEQQAIQAANQTDM